MGGKQKRTLVKKGSPKRLFRKSDNDSNDESETDSKPSSGGHEEERATTRRANIVDDDADESISGGKKYEATSDRNDDSDTGDDSEKGNEMTEFERERVLASRYERKIRQRQRSQLFEHSGTSAREADSQKKKQEAFLDIRAKRHRKKQKQNASLSGDEENDEPGTRRSREVLKDGWKGRVGDVSDDDDDMVMSDSDFDADGSATERSMKNGSQKGSESDDEDIVKSATKRRVGDESSSRIDSLKAKEDEKLFADGEADVDVMRSRYNRGKILDSVSFECVQGVFLSTERILHMLEHPKAGEYLKGCFVKLSKSEAIYYIIGVTECASYQISGRQCRHKLNLRQGTTSGMDRSENLTALSSKGITEQDFKTWKSFIVNEKVQKASIHMWPKKMKMKLEKLKEFTFTEEDVERILQQNALNVGGNLVKQIHSVMYEIQALKQSMEGEGQRKETSRSKKLADLEFKLQYLQALDSRKSSVSRQRSSLVGGRLKGYSSSRIGKKMLSEAISPKTQFNTNSSHLHKPYTTETDLNPFGRRECRPTMMWDIGTGAEVDDKIDDALSPETPQSEYTPKSDAQLATKNEEKKNDNLVARFAEQYESLKAIQQFYSTFDLSSYFGDFDVNKIPQRDLSDDMQVKGHIKKQ